MGASSDAVAAGGVERTTVLARTLALPEGVLKKATNVPSAYQKI